MKARIIEALFAVELVALSGSICTGADLPRGSPEAQGVSSSAVLSFVEAADKDIDSMNSFMLLCHGHVVAEGWWSPYHAETPHSLYSLSKRFTSTAVGLAIAEGKLSLDDEVLKFFPEDAPPEPSNNLKAMRVSDLLRMSTGHQSEPPRTLDRPWPQTDISKKSSSEGAIAFGCETDPLGHQTLSESRRTPPECILLITALMLPQFYMSCRATHLF